MPVAARPHELVEAVIFNSSTPDAALMHLASHTPDPRIIEAIWSGNEFPESLLIGDVLYCPLIPNKQLKNPVQEDK